MRKRILIDSSCFSSGTVRLRVGSRIAVFPKWLISIAYVLLHALAHTGSTISKECGYLFCQSNERRQKCERNSEESREAESFKRPADAGIKPQVWGRSSGYSDLVLESPCRGLR